jgi:4a-hydroxytetrahydrobiopterin dehydratase
MDDSAALVDQHCTACQKGAPKVEPAEAAVLAATLPEWSIVEREGIPRLERVFRFAGYLAALAFVQRVGELADSENHHPVMTVSYNRVTVTWWTHAIKGLHLNDFIMAAKTDRLANSS